MHAEEFHAQRYPKVQGYIGKRKEEILEESTSLYTACWSVILLYVYLRCQPILFRIYEDDLLPVVKRSRSCGSLHLVRRWGALHSIAQSYPNL